MKPTVFLLALCAVFPCLGADPAAPADRLPAADTAVCKPEPISTPAAKPRFQFWWRHELVVDVTVHFRFQIAHDGTVSDVRLIPGDYHADFGREVEKAVRTWRYKPLVCPGRQNAWMKSYMRFSKPAPDAPGAK